VRRGGEENLLGAFLEERMAHEVKDLRRSIAWVLVIPDFMGQLGDHVLRPTGPRHGVPRVGLT
jgi:hypothetical protein